jgi:hypothetical protein
MGLRIEPRIIASWSALDDLAMKARRAMVLPPVELHLPGLSPPQAAHWQSVLNQHIAACGCQEGQIAALSSVALYVVWLVLCPSSPTLTTVHAIAIAFAVACVGALLGKTVGLWHARNRLRDAIRGLRTVTQSNAAKSRSGEAPAACGLV